MMRVRMLKTSAGPDAPTRRKGDVVDLPAKEAKILLEGNVAEPVDIDSDENSEAVLPSRVADRRPSPKPKRPPRRRSK